MKKRREKPIQPKLRLKDRRRRMMWVQLAAGALLVIVLAAFVFYVARLPSITIADVEIRGAEIVTADSVEHLVREKLAGSYIFLIPHANAFFAPRTEIEKAIRAAYPAVGTVALSHRELETLVVTLGERIPAALWCAKAGDSVSESPANEACYFMDDSGFVYTEADAADGFIRYYGALDEVPIGSRYLAGEFPLFRVFVEETEALLKRSVESVSVDSLSDASMTFAEGGVLYFTRTADHQLTLANIASVFASQRFQETHRFEYADFRYGNKVYVKFVGE